MKLNDYGKQLLVGRMSLFQHVNKMMDAINNNESLEGYDITLSFGDQQIKFELNADLYSELELVINNQIKEYGDDE